MNSIYQKINYSLRIYDWLLSFQIWTVSLKRNKSLFFHSNSASAFHQWMRLKGLNECKWNVNEWMNEWDENELKWIRMNVNECMRVIKSD